MRSVETIERFNRRNDWGCAVSVRSGNSTRCLKTAGWLYLAGTLTGVAFCGLWVAAAAVVWTRPEKAAALGVMVSVVMMTLTIIVIVLHQLDGPSDS
jgi:hypothetical protein